MKSTLMDPALWELLRVEEDAGPSREIEALIRFHRPGVDLPAVRTVARFGAVATCRIAVDDVVDVREHPDVASLKAPRALGTARTWRAGARGGPPPPAAQPSDVRRPMGTGPTGLGVVLGCVDWGFDLDSPAFRRPPRGDATPGTRAGGTRVLALWDQRDRSAGEPPAPYGYGVVHHRAAIDRALLDPRPYDALGYHPAAADRGLGTHGTHVLDIAAGNGRAGGPRGLAPEADLVLVHLADRGTGGLANLGDSVRLLEALDFITRTAAGRPCVINTSVGRHGGPHDGTTLAEIAVEHLLATTPGLVVVKSTGNYYRARAHASGTLAPGEERTVTFRVHADDATPNELEVWYDGADDLAVRMTAPGCPPGPWVPLGSRSDVTVDGRVVGRIHHRATDPNNGAHHVDAFLFPPALPGKWALSLRAQRVRSGRWDAWLERDDACPRCQTRFVAADTDPASTLGTLANGRLDLVVGAYDAHDPARPPAAFSSAGPTRDGRGKPDVAAPGVDVLAARSAPAGALTSPGLCVRKSGTSMAAPHVAGAVALCLQLALEAGRLLSASEVRDLVLGSCEPPTSRDPRLGCGYLDIPRLLRATRDALAATTDHTRESAMDTALLSSDPAAAYRDLLYRPDDARARRVDERYDVLARPGQRLDLAPRAGDVLLEVELGRLGRGRSTVLDAGAAAALRGSLPPGQLLLRPRAGETGSAGGPGGEDLPDGGDVEDARTAELDRLIDRGLPENQITNAVFYARNPRLAGATLDPGSAAAREWLAIRAREVRPRLRARVGVSTVDPVDLAIFLSQYENDTRVPSAVTKRFLTGSPLLSLGRSLRDRVLANWLRGGAPLTTQSLFRQALDLSGDAGTAVLLCHNVTKAFVREGVAVTWRGTGTEGEYTDGQKTYRARRIHRAGRLTYHHPAKKREVTSIFYLLFSDSELGTQDPGDWYHLFTTACMTALASTGAMGAVQRRGRSEQADDQESAFLRGGKVGAAAYRDLLAANLGALAGQLTDTRLAALPGYDGWVLANAISFLEGAHYGSDYADDQSDVARESGVHLRGAIFGLRAIGSRPGPTWSWRVPVAGSVSKTDLVVGIDLGATTWQVWDPQGRPRTGKSTETADAAERDAPDDAEDDVPGHVSKAREWWSREFGTDPVLGKVKILDLARVPSEPVRTFGYSAWTNSATRVYVAAGAAADPVTLDRVLRHEARHVRQFAATGRPATYETMLRYEREAYGADQELLSARRRELVAELTSLRKELRSVDRQLPATRERVRRLEKVLAPRRNPETPQAREQRYRRFMATHDLLPAHRSLDSLYDPPASSRNPAAQEAAVGGGYDAEQLAMPHVTAIRFRNAGTSDPANACATCPTALGVGAGGTGSNGMELRFRIEGHRAGMEYDVTRTRRDSLWQRVGGVWTRLGANAMGTNDDHHDDDEALTPRNGFIYVIDRPGVPGLALPAPAVAVGGGTVWPGVVTSAAAQDVVLRYSFAEWVIARHRGDGIPWTRLELPPLPNGSPRLFVFWRCVVWLTRNGAGNFVLDPRSRIERGSISSAVLNAVPT